MVGVLTLAVVQSLLPTIIRSMVPCVVPHAVVGVGFGMYSVAENFGKVIGHPLVGYLKDTTVRSSVHPRIKISRKCLLNFLTLTQPLCRAISKTTPSYLSA